MPFLAFIGWIGHDQYPLPIRNYEFFVVVLLAGFLPKLRKYDVMTDKFAMGQRRIRNSKN